VATLLIAAAIPAIMPAIFPAIVPAVVRATVQVAAIAVMALIVNVAIGPVKVTAQVGALDAIDAAVGSILPAFLAAHFVAVQIAAAPALLDALLLAVQPRRRRFGGNGGAGSEAGDGQNAQ